MVYGMPSSLLEPLYLWEPEACSACILAAVCFSSLLIAETNGQISYKYVVGELLAAADLCQTVVILQPAQTSHSRGRLHFRAVLWTVYGSSSSCPGVGTMKTVVGKVFPTCLVARSSFSFCYEEPDFLTFASGSLE